MHVPRVCVPALFALFGAALPVAAQSIVSTHAGVIHYFEGDVSIAGTALQPQFGRFPEIPAGAELRTTEGRAEVLLGPGVMLRLAENSGLRVLSSSLADARLEMLSGTAILHAKDPLPGNSLALLYKAWEVRIPKQGVYRIDTNPEQLRVYFGEVEVRAAKDAPVLVKAGQTLPLAAILVPDLTLGPPGDEFNRWAFDRGEAIAADNATAAQIVDDPALYPATDLSGLALAGYTYFPPTIGNPYLGYGSSGYTGYGYGGSGYGGYGGYGFGNAYLGSYFGSRLGQSFAYPYRPLYPGVSGVTAQPPHLRVPGGGAPIPRPVLHSPSLPRPAPVTPHPAPHPIIRGGRR